MPLWTDDRETEGRAEGREVETDTHSFGFWRYGRRGRHSRRHGTERTLQRGSRVKGDEVRLLPRALCVLIGPEFLVRDFLTDPHFGLSPLGSHVLPLLTWPLPQRVPAALR